MTKRSPRRRKASRTCPHNGTWNCRLARFGYRRTICEAGGCESARCPGASCRSRPRLLFIPRFVGGLFRGAVFHGPRSYIAPWRQIVPRCVAVSRKISTIPAAAPIRAQQRQAFHRGRINCHSARLPHRPKGRQRSLRLALNRRALARHLFRSGLAEQNGGERNRNRLHI